MITKPEQLIFHIIDSVNIGFICVVFTPIEIWNKINNISQLVDLSEMHDLFNNKLELVQESNYKYEYNGDLNKFELKDKMINIGFNYDNKYSKFIDFLFNDIYVPTDIDELKQLGLLQ
jgi:hypothetical protein